jgi:hypothetical protein
MENDLLSAAILKVKSKVAPLSVSVESAKEEPHKSLFSMLDVWYEDSQDEDVNKKVKFIFDTLGENPKDKLLSLYTKLGACPPLQKNVDRVYKWCRLQDQANKAMLRYEQIKKDQNEIGVDRRNG